MLFVDSFTCVMCRMRFRPLAVLVSVAGPSCHCPEHSQQSAVRLAVLPSCKSQWAGEVFVDAGVPHVICINGAVDVQDVAVLRFTRALYTSLACGQSVQAAFLIAKQSVASQPDIPVGCARYLSLTSLHRPASITCVVVTLLPL